jgi:hypothetical protein
MAGGTLSQDIVAICLVLAEGDANVDLEQVMLEADRFQEANNRHFGLTRQDLRGLFASLFAWDLGSEHPLAIRLGRSWLEHKFKGVQLREIIPLILPFQEAYFNDEGEYWVHLDIATREEYRSHGYKGWYGYNWEEYCQKVQMKQVTKELFSKRESRQPEPVVQFMKIRDIDDRLLYHCSRPGESR